MRHLSPNLVYTRGKTKMYPILTRAIAVSGHGSVLTLTFAFRATLFMTLSSANHVVSSLLWNVICRICHPGHLRQVYLSSVVPDCAISNFL